MSMSPQIVSLSKNVTFHLRNITRIRRFLKDNNTCNHIVRSLILSRLDYGHVLLTGANLQRLNLQIATLTELECLIDILRYKKRTC